MQRNMNGVSYSCSDLKFAAVNSEASLPVADSALYLGEIPPYKHEDVSEVIRYLMHNVTDEMHRTHHIFCEMDVLHKEADDLEWKESARWVKYEEDVEDGGERWSKPHVASLSMHALFALKKCVYEGAVLLDVLANDMPSVIDRVIRAWRENCGMSDPEEQELVRKVLLKRHKHLNAKRKYRANQEKLRSSKSLVDQNHAHLRTAKSTGNLKTSSSCSSIDSGVTNGEIGDLNSHSKGNMHFMRKIPKDSEAASMMVGTIDSLTNFYMAFVRLQKSGMIGQLTEVSLPTKFLFILLSPSGYRNEIQEIGRSISTMMIDEIFGEVAYKCRNKTDLIAGIEEFMAQGTVLPPGEWDPKIRIEPPVSVPSQELRRSSSVASSWKDNEKEEEEEVVESHIDPSLFRSGRLFGGLVRDIKRKVPWFLSDFKDSLHIQSLASVVFLFLATFTQNVTFGGILGNATDGYMGTMECILTAALTGVVFSLFAGQPLNILGSTGPMLVLETILYTICRDNGWDFMPVRFWIGMWTTLLLLIIVAFDLSSLVKYITRFTEESFACLIAIIFIIEAFEKLVHIGTDVAPMNLHPELDISKNCSCNFENVTLGDFFNETACKQMNGTLSGDGCKTVEYKDNVFLMSILLFLGTFTISMALKMFRNGPCFPTIVRQTVSDFSVFIAIIVMSAVDSSVGLDTPKLVVPSEFQPTDPTKRAWVINPISSKNPWWLYIAAVLPALLAAILIFLDQQITSVIVNRRENKLKKGGGYHLDMLIVAILVAICSVFGLPWYVAATVSALAHIMSLKKESECNAPGERPTFLGVREQRVTGTLVGILSGVSVLLTSILQIIPMPVLYGVFLYMGIVALSSMQLMTRLMLFVIPKKYQDDLPYLRHVQLLRVHLFTLIQLLCLGLLVTIKSIKKVSIIFPVMVLATCVVRKVLDYVFTQRELRWLDDVLPNSKKVNKDEEESTEKRNVPVELEQNGGTGNKPTFYISGDSTNL